MRQVGVADDYEGAGAHKESENGAVHGYKIPHVVDEGLAREGHLE